MKKIMVNGASALLGALSLAFSGSMTLSPPIKTRNRGKGRGRLGRPVRNWSNRTTDKRHWHDPSNRLQQSVMRAADEKRQRKADKRAVDAYSSMNFNLAHGRGLMPGLNPFYINRGEVV